ncbi:hypothetical protein KA013_03440 [Patescibacteria group bacterium]|nr:hypothetical protein [Patescibacteria group bacterium]
MCNPPYIPRKKSIEDNAYEGLELVQHLLTHVDSFLTPHGKLIINLSSLGNEITLPYLDHLQQNGRNVETKNRSMEVPLKVFNVLNNKERFGEILANPGLIQKPNHPHPYRHQLTIYEISRKIS